MFNSVARHLDILYYSFQFVVFWRQYFNNVTEAFFNKFPVIVWLFGSCNVPSHLIPCKQWWILGEANESVASGSPFLGGPLENSTYSFILLQVFCRNYYEVGTKSGKYKLDSRLRLFFVFLFFLEITMILREKIAKSEMKSK